MPCGNGRIIYVKFIPPFSKNGRSYKSWDKIFYRDNWPQDMPNEHRRLVDTANAPICCWPLCFHFELPEDTTPWFEPREEREIFILDMWCPRAKTATWSGSTTFNRRDPAVRVSTPSRLPSLPHPLLARRRRSLHCSSQRRRPIH